jgi:hypothetical protein
MEIRRLGKQFAAHHAQIKLSGPLIDNGVAYLHSMAEIELVQKISWKMKLFMNGFRVASTVQVSKSSFFFKKDKNIIRFLN